MTRRLAPQEPAHDARPLWIADPKRICEIFAQVQT
jgi:hypothetical protein